MIHIQAAKVDSSRSIRVDDLGHVYNAGRTFGIKQIDTMRVARWDPQVKTKRGKIRRLRLQYWRLPRSGDLAPWWNTAEQFHNHCYNRKGQYYGSLRRAQFERP